MKSIGKLFLNRSLIRLWRPILHCLHTLALSSRFCLQNYSRGFDHFNGNINCYLPGEWQYRINDYFWVLLVDGRYIYVRNSWTPPMNWFLERFLMNLILFQLHFQPAIGSSYNRLHKCPLEIHMIFRTE